MTFLELVQTLHRESGSSGPQPTTVVNQTGETGRLVNWIISADHQIQERWIDWRFLWDDDYSYTTVAGTATVDKPSHVGDWDRKTFTVDDQPLIAEDYRNVRGEVFNTDAVYRNKPCRVIINPDNSLRFDPVPDKAYTIKAHYYRKPVELANDADVSRIPERFHRVIIGQALLFYGAYEDAEYVAAHGRIILDDMMKSLEANERSGARDNLLSSGESFQVVTP